MKNKILAVMVALAMVIGMPMMAMAEEEMVENYGIAGEEAPTGEPIPTNEEELDIVDAPNDEGNYIIAAPDGTKVNNSPVIIVLCVVVVVGVAGTGAYIYTKSKKKE